MDLRFSHPHGRRWRGFSTIELFAVVVITLILSVIAVAGYRVYQHQMPVKYTAQRMVHSFSVARAFAISQNTVYAVQIDPVHRNYWIDQTDQNGAPQVPKVVSPELIDAQVDIDSVQFSLGQPVINGPVISIRFFPDGSSDDVHVFFRMKVDDATVPFSIFTVRLYGPTGESRLFENQRL
jgi:Tfp pilus assembly protein FimT